MFLICGGIVGALRQSCPSSLARRGLLSKPSLPRRYKLAPAARDDNWVNNFDASKDLSFDICLSVSHFISAHTSVLLFFSSKKHTLLAHERTVLYKFYKEEKQFSICF